MGLINRPPELLEELAAHAAVVLVERARVPAPIAEQLGLLIAARVAQMWGGRKVRIPKGTWNRRELNWAQREQRNAEIYAAFDGSNISELVAATGLCRQHVYSVLRAARASVRAGRIPAPAQALRRARPSSPQADLFAESAVDVA